MTSIRKSKKELKKKQQKWGKSILDRVKVFEKPTEFPLTLLTAYNNVNSGEYTWRKVEDNSVLYIGGCDPCYEKDTKEAKALKSFSLVKWENGVPTIIK